MPELQPIVILGVILVSFPLQLLLSPSATSDIKYHLQILTDRILDFLKDYGYQPPGAEQRQKLFAHHRFLPEEANAEKEYYASSKKVRQRTSDMKFRIGDVVYNKLRKYRGLVIGWDLRAHAPPEFMDALKQSEEWQDGPHYAILIDGKDRLQPEMGYSPQMSLVLSEGRIHHHLISRYAERYDEKLKKYVLRPRLRDTYPDD
ncbi:unnamed protein product [Auanema sp. JU1783]|nr:unnamed protein product [Auanema sp. JU1783]